MLKTDLAQQAKAIQGRKNRQAQAKRAKVAVVQPTPEHQAKNETQSMGMARRIVPMIDILKKRGDITEREYDALKHYRQQGDIVNRSPSRDSCDFSVKGGSDGSNESASVASAKVELSRLDLLLGQLRGICWAVCVDDCSLTDWAIQEHGSREKTKRGKTVMVPRGAKDGKNHIDFARWELKFAANRMIA